MKALMRMVGFKRRYSEDLCRKMVEHYERMCRKHERDIIERWKENPEFAAIYHGGTDASSSILADIVYQGLRDDLGFWRIQLRDATGEDE